MNTELIIALNLAILLVAGIVIAIGTYRNEIKYRQRLKRLADSLKDKLEETLKRNRELEEELSRARVDATAQAVGNPEDVEADVKHALNSLKQQLDLRNKKIEMLEEFKSRHSGEPGADTEELDSIIDGLRQELEVSRAHVESLEKDVADNRILRTRVSQLSREEGRHRSTANKLRDKLADASRNLAEMMHLSKKAEGLQKDNVRLHQQVNDLSTKTEYLTTERDNLSAMYNEAANKERFQRKRIAQLEQQLVEERAQSVNAPTDTELQAKVEALEAELDEVRNELERTLKEKAMIETHMLAMDKAASQLDQREAEFERLKKEHETLEMHFLMDSAEDNSPLQVEVESNAVADPHVELEFEALSESLAEDNIEFVGQKTTDVDPRKAKHSEAYASPLFLSVSEFWAKFIDDKDEVVIVSTSVPNKPSRLCMWTYVFIGDEDMGIVLGVDRDLSERVASAIFDKPQAEVEEDDVIDSVGEMTNIVAGFVANNLGDSRKLSAPKHIQRDELDQLMFYMKTTAEILVGTQHGRLYLGTIQKTI
ncbi:hypothetical protein R50073_40570 [Maricurvus nonylphenolicus]|uniref:chemotaxis protein CheX n=1 Tax=Maricurvus nonylphenolicus TaxID=1008307 RepID=UPI0036F3C1A0